MKYLARACAPSGVHMLRRKSRRDRCVVRELVMNELPGSCGRAMLSRPTAAGSPSLTAWAAKACHPRLVPFPLAVSYLMIQGKLTGIQQGPENVAVGFR